MASIRLDNELSSLFDVEMARCHTSQEILELFSTLKFSPFFEVIKKILYHYHYVHISNINFTPKRYILEAFANYFGTFRSPVENTNVRIDCSHDGCSIESLVLHNDDAMLDLMPTFGILQIENECPLKMPTNGIVLIDDIINYLQLYNKKLLKKLFTYKVPMLSSNVSKIIENNKVVFQKKGNDIFTRKSILVKQDGIIESRFNIGRINYYYYKMNKKQPIKEKKMIAEFLEIANRFRKSIYLKKNDILIYNNKRTLHDRSESGLEFGLNNEIKSRSFYIAFAN